MSEYEKAKKIAAGFVGRKMYTCREIEDRLKRRGISSDIAETVVSDFAKAGILDDAAYARAYAEESVRLGSKGVYRIKQELYAKGVAKSLIDTAVSECEADTLEELCRYVKDRNLCEGISSRKDLEKLKARLARRGFSLDEIRKCLSEYDFVFNDEY